MSWEVSTPARRARSSTVSAVKRPVALRWTIVAVLFLAGLYLRLTVFESTHQEGDESIYITLVQQLDSGHGYTLQGSQILTEGMIDREEYDHPLFFHPPGGIALDWIFYKTIGDWGFAYVQLFSYAVWFASMMLLASLLGLASSTLGLTLVAALSAFNPIMSHVATRYWLDGPLLAFTTLAVAVFLWAALRGKTIWVIVAGLLLGYASWIKITAFLVVPGVVLLAWVLLAPAPAVKVKAVSTVRSKKAAAPPASTAPRGADPRRKLLLWASLWIVTAVVVQLPWEIWQWRVAGSPFPGWAGKPSQTLIDANRYVRYLTVVRSPWVYVTLTPRILWTWVPTALLCALCWTKTRARWLSFSLLLWLGAVLGFHVAVGYYGYSKVLRYIILVAPPSILLFALLFEETVRIIRDPKSGALYRQVAFLAICVCVGALCLEIAAGVSSSTSIKNDLLVPIWGKAF
jgi:4-amino-4-deoxy-L-arabinose transferase-like glycosyltransferase